MQTGTAETAVPTLCPADAAAAARGTCGWRERSQMEHTTPQKIISAQPYMFICFLDRLLNLQQDNEVHTRVKTASAAAEFNDFQQLEQVFRWIVFKEKWTAA